MGWEKVHLKIHSICWVMDRFLESDRQTWSLCSTLILIVSKVHLNIHWLAESETKIWVGKVWLNFILSIQLFTYLSSQILWWYFDSLDTLIVVYGIILPDCAGGRIHASYIPLLAMLVWQGERAKVQNLLSMIRMGPMTEPWATPWCRGIANL